MPANGIWDLNLARLWEWMNQPFSTATALTLILPTWRICWAPNASKWQMGFNSEFKGLITLLTLFLVSLGLQGRVHKISAGSRFRSRMVLFTCWAIKKHWNNKFHYTVASCWFFVRDLYSRFFDAVDYRNSTVWTVCEWTVWLEEFVMPEAGSHGKEVLNRASALFQCWTELYVCTSSPSSPMMSQRSRHTLLFCYAYIPFVYCGIGFH
jgi:hypothetical protein